MTLGDTWAFLYKDTVVCGPRTEMLNEIRRTEREITRCNGCVVSSENLHQGR